MQSLEEAGSLPEDEIGSMSISPNLFGGAALPADQQEGPADDQGGEDQDEEDAPGVGNGGEGHGAVQKAQPPLGAGHIQEGGQAGAGDGADAADDHDEQDLIGHGGGVHLGLGVVDEHGKQGAPHSGEGRDAEDNDLFLLRRSGGRPVAMFVNNTQAKVYTSTMTYEILLIVVISSIGSISTLPASSMWPARGGCAFWTAP